MSRAAQAGLTAAFEQLLELPERLAQAERRIAQLEAQARAERSDAELVAAAEVARMTGRSRRALDEMFRRRRLAGEQHPLEGLARDVDGRRMWSRGDVLRWIEAQR